MVSESLIPNTPSRPPATNSFSNCKEIIPAVKLDSTLPQQGQGWNPLNHSWPALIYCSTLTCRDPVRIPNSCSASVPTFHGCLEGVDGVDFGDDDSGSKAPQGLGTALAHVPISCHHCHLPSNHDICGTLDAIDEGLSAAIEVIKLALREKTEQFQNRWNPLKWNFLRERKWTYVQVLWESNTLTTMRDRQPAFMFLFIQFQSIGYIRHRLQHGEKHFINTLCLLTRAWTC